MATRSGFPTANAFMPEQRTLPALREAAATCEGCDLHRNATQAVFGQGARGARVVLVGEALVRDGDPERALRAMTGVR